MYEYKTRCAYCNKPLEISSSRPRTNFLDDRDNDYCNANCEQSYFDAGNDPTLWSEQRKQEEVNKD